MGFWYLIYKNLSCTIDNSILISKSNLKRGKTISVDRMSYRAAIVNPTATLPRFFCKKRQTHLQQSMCFKVIYACKQTFTTKLCTYASRYVLDATPISAIGFITLVKLSHYGPHYQNGVCTYHGAVCLCAHMATTHAFDFKQYNIKMFFKYVVKTLRKYSIRISSTPLHCKAV